MLELVHDTVQGPEDVAPFYLELIQPALWEVGALWETGEISVAQEHLVSAMAVRAIGDGSSGDDPRLS